MPERGTILNRGGHLEKVPLISVPGLIKKLRLFELKSLLHGDFSLDGDS